MSGLFKKFYSCPNCGKAICEEKKMYFVCPNCGRALCAIEDLESYNDNYCGNCGTGIASAREEALALAVEEG